MLRRVTTSLLRWEQHGLLGAASQYSSQAADYTLVLKTAAEIGAPAKPMPDKEVGYAAGVPLETFQRKAQIFVPSRSAGQQGLAMTGAPEWRIQFDNSAKWVNPLMGWTSSADPLENVARTTWTFYTKEQAIAFCVKHGWGYEVTEPAPRVHKRSKRFLGYGDNFSVKRKGIPDLSTQRSNRESK